MQDYSVDKWSCVTVKNSHYSVPDSLVGKRVAVKLYSEKVLIFSEGNKVARHERQYKSGAWAVDIHHYLTTLSHKPGALRTSTALTQAHEGLQKLFERHFKDSPKNFIDVMLYAQAEGFSDEDVMDAYARLRSTGIKSVTSDHLKSMLHKDDRGEAATRDCTGNNPLCEMEKIIALYAEDTLNTLTNMLSERKSNESRILTTININQYNTPATI